MSFYRKHHKLLLPRAHYLFPLSFLYTVSWHNLLIFPSSCLRFHLLLIFLLLPVKLILISGFLTVLLPNQFWLRNGAILADYLVQQMQAIAGSVLRFISETHPTWSALNASKLITSENKFLYHWQYSSTNFTVGLASRRSIILPVKVSSLTLDYTPALVTKEG